MKQAAFSYDKEKIADVSQRYGLRFVILFGSYAREEEKDTSDVDVAVLAEHKPDAELFGILFSAFSEIFPHKEIDVRFLNNPDLLFRFQVVKDGVLLYGDKKEYEAYYRYSIKSYVDDGRKYFPFRDQLLREQQQKLEEAL